jgi:very-short-patch-repair endonuclease
LRRMGWRVVRLWQHQIKANTTGCLRKILDTK